MVLPIPRVKPLGWVDDELLTAAQITQMDLNISLLDGAYAEQVLRSDMAQFRNFRTTIAIAGTRVDFVDYDSVSCNWLAFGVDASFHLVSQYSRNGGRTWAALSTGLTATNPPRCLATDGAGTFVLGYATPSPGTQKSAWSTDLFTTVHPITTGASSSAAAVAVHYSARLARWFLTLDNGTIWTATVPSGTWTQTYINGAISSISSFAESADRILVRTDSSSLGSSVLSSLDGLTWTPISGPVLFPSALVFAPSLGFVCYTTTAEFYFSATGATWALGGAIALTDSMFALRSSGGMVIFFGSVGGLPFDLYYSFDLAVWKRFGSIDDTSSPTGCAFTIGDHQCMLASNSVPSAGSIIYPGLAL